MSTTFLKKFSGHLIKKGKKTKALKILFRLMKSFRKNKYLLLESVFYRIKPYVEVRKVRVRRSSSLVPFPVNPARQMHLSSLWILTALKKDKRRISFPVKLREELRSLLRLKGEAFKKKTTMYSLAQKNRSNFHYRWY
jgi:ribosomal protein S7